MMENRLPDARELSYQHLMARRVKQTFKALFLGSRLLRPLSLAASRIPVEETRFL